jgi:hypothetical protein
LKQRKKERRERFSHVRTSSDTQTVIFASLPFSPSRAFAYVHANAGSALKYNLEALIMHYLPAKCTV